jgi:hypothetical protein
MYSHQSGVAALTSKRCVLHDNYGTNRVHEVNPIIATAIGRS